jgi:agmatine deiminase
MVFLSGIKRSVKSTLVILILAALCLCTAGAQAGTTAFIYTATPGDTYYSLSQRFDTTAADIASRNPAVDPNNLSVGTKLRIAAGNGVVLYTVRSGDTLWKISVRSSTPIGAIIKQNYLNNSSFIYPGVVLAIPRLRFLPGEFDRQQAIWLQWPSDVYNMGSQPVYPVTVRIVKALAPYIHVNLAVADSSQIPSVKGLLNTGGFSDTNVSYPVVGHYSIWARDVAPVFVKDQFGALYVPDFGFNNYGRGGNTYYIGTEGSVHRQVAEKLGLPIIGTGLISEGGAVESNGRGTIMLVEAVALPRNPGMTKQQIEDEYKRVLGVTKVIWLKQGLKEDDRITGGHINEFARFADPHTILLAQVLPSDTGASPTAQESGRRMEVNCGILRNSTDQDGKPFRIVRIPIPPTLYAEASSTGRSPVYSYLNFAITNGAVILPSYWKPGRSDALRGTEAQVVSTFTSVFPGRDIVRVEAESVNLLWGGGIHCMTQHMPAI